MPVYYAKRTFNLLNLDDPNDMPRGSRFMPSSSPTLLSNRGIEPFPDSLEAEFEKYLHESKSCSILFTKKRKKTARTLKIERDLLKGTNIKRKETKKVCYLLENRVWK